MQLTLARGATATRMPQRSVCPPVGFDCVINSFVSRNTLGPYLPPFRSNDTGPYEICSPLVLYLLPANNGFLSSTSGLGKEAVYSLYGQRSLDISKGALRTPISICQRGRSKALHVLKRGTVIDHRHMALGHCASQAAVSSAALGERTNLPVSNLRLLPWPGAC